MSRWVMAWGAAAAGCCAAAALACAPRGAAKSRRAVPIRSPRGVIHGTLVSGIPKCHGDAHGLVTQSPHVLGHPLRARLRFEGRTMQGQAARKPMRLTAEDVLDIDVPDHLLGYELED